MDDTLIPILLRSTDIKIPPPSKRKYYFFILTILGIFFWVHQIDMPLVLWNKTASVPLGLYIQIRSTTPLKKNDNAFLEKVFVALSPEVLLVSRKGLNKTQNKFLHTHGNMLLEKNILLLKRISKEDLQFYIEYHTFPQYIKVVSYNTRGIDYRSLGRIDKKFIRALYKPLLLF